LFLNLKKLDLGLEERQHVIVLKGAKAKDVLDYKADLKSIGVNQALELNKKNGDQLKIC
jgi:hypothetical protein